jgi:hypothetical protein
VVEDRPQRPRQPSFLAAWARSDQHRQPEETPLDPAGSITVTAQGTRARDPLTVGHAALDFDLRAATVYARAPLVNHLSDELAHEIPRDPATSPGALITSVDPVSRQVARGRAKPPGSDNVARPRWRPTTSKGKDVDPA